MRFKIDENLHDEVADLLTNAGYDAHTVHAEDLSGAEDADLARRYALEDRVLISLDLDFADIRMHPPSASPGLIVMRVGSQNRRHVLSIMQRVLTLLQRKTVRGKLWIVSDTGVRIRER